MIGKMKINIVGILGCGMMGSGIAIVVCSARYKTVTRETLQR
jgi:3-hydroxyacyl-CoA dehydrogenase